MRPSRLRLVLTVLTFLPLAGSLLAGVSWSRDSMEAAYRDLLKAETAAAVELWRETGNTGVLDHFFLERWHFSERPDPTVDEAVAQERDGELVGKAAVYDADSWYQVGVLSISQAPDRVADVRRIPWAIIVAVLLFLALASWSWNKTNKRRALPLLTTLAVLLMTSWIVSVEEKGTLEKATLERVGLAVESLTGVRDVEALIAQPGGVYTLTGLPFLVRDETGGTEFSSLPSAVTEALERIPPPVEGRVVADRIEYHVADVGRARLVMVPYESVYGSGAVLVALALVGVLTAALPAWLTRFVEERRIFREHVTAWSFLSPSFVLLIVFTIGPLLFAAWLSFHRWSLLDVARPFVGLGHYLRLFRDASWWNAVRNTAVFTLHVPVAMAAALGLALLVERPRRGIVLLRTVLFLPSITSLVAIAIAWQWMLHDEYGLVNWILSWVGLGPVRWLTSTKTALLAIMMLSVWMVVGYQIVLFQAGLAAIPRELYDAARIDGAGPWRRFFHVTLPGLRDTLFFVLVTSVIGSFQVFGAVYVMTEGGPLHSTDVAVFHIYEEAWEFFRFGDAAAMSWFLFAMIFVVSWLQFRTLERRVEDR